MKKHQNFICTKKISLSGSALCILHIGLPLIILEMIFLIFSFTDACKQDAVYAIYYYSSVLEYIWASLVLVILGAFLFDYMAKQNK